MTLTHDTRRRSIRLIWVLGGLGTLLAVAAVLLVPRPRWDEAVGRCQALYAAAPAAADTASADTVRAFAGVAIRRSGMTCGDLRRGGRLSVRTDTSGT